MSVCLSLLMCFFVFGIFYLQRKIRHCIKQACMSWMASTRTQIASSSSSGDSSIGCKVHLMKRRLLIRIRSRPSLAWKCPKKKIYIASSSSSSTSMRTQIASSSSSSTPSRRYEVFLSFHGKDTRKTFTDHLHYGLKHKGINVFRDDEKLERGKTISEELLKAIQESKYAVVVISPNYASSRWCLIELAKIIECMKDTGLKVLPIFYHVDPSDVRNQTETFAEAFAKHEASMRLKNPKVDIDMMHKWRSALRKVGNIAGWHVDDGYESNVIGEICSSIFDGLTIGSFSIVFKDFVGISRVKEIMTLLSIGLDDVRYLGIYGMGGIGKTTLSKAIYARVYDQFEASCFIADIREASRTHGLVSLRKQLISEILMEREINIGSEFVAWGVIENRLRNKKVLIVLDDVDEEEQLKALAGSHHWFGQGSRIIITSRDQHLLNKFEVPTYKVKMLNENEALQLFSRKAFKKSYPEENYVELSKEVVNYAQGLPLALEVFGSFLFGRNMDEWQSARDFLKENPNAKILDKLKISFDGLEPLEKELFLDIACFFNGKYMDNMIINILESFGYYPYINIKALVDKSLITINGNFFRMHNLLQKMGQEIVSCKSTKQLGERSRLWRYEDVLHVLKNDIGTDAVKGIDLKLPSHIQERLNVKAFSKMKELKMLQISPHFYTNLEWHGDPSNFMLSNELCVMKWWRYPLKSLPASFQSNKLVELTMYNSRIKELWDGRKSFDKLKRICLSFSVNLIETPDLSEVPNLEELELEYCTSLCKVHPSIGSLERLKHLNLRSCKRLKRLPDEMSSLSSLVSLDICYCSRLEEIPKYMIGGMKCLELLRVGGSAKRKFPIGSEPYRFLIPNSFSGFSSLRDLNLSYCNLSDGSIPSDFSYLSSLQYLNLSRNKFTRIPYSAFQLSNLIKLDLSYCNLLDGAIPNDLSCLSSLYFLNLSGNKFKRIPDSVAQLLYLRHLDLNNCSWLQVLPKLPLGLEGLRIRNCPALELFYNKQMEMWRTSNEILRSNIDCSVLQAFIDYDGKPFKILHLHPRSPIWRIERFEYFYPKEIGGVSTSYISLNDCFYHEEGEKELEYCYYDGVACGPALVGSGIPAWFNDKSTNSFGTIQLHSDLGGLDIWWDLNGYAIFIVYEFHEPHSTHPRKSRKRKVDERNGNSNSPTYDGGNPNFPIFVCQFQYQVNGFDVKKPLVLCAPGVPSVGPNRFWVYIPVDWFGRTHELGNTFRSLEASITTGSLNVEVKECGARLLHDKNDASELYQLLNTISPRALGFESYENLFPNFNYKFFCVSGPIIIKSNDVASGSIGSVNG